MSGDQLRIRINNSDREVTATPGKSLLASLRDAGVFLSSGCGGRGACGMCRVKVVSGLDSPFSAAELHWLSEKERGEGMRLACQVVLTGDLEIEVPPNSSGLRQYECRVASIRDLTHDVKEVRIRLVAPAEMTFKAGQFIQLKIPPYDAITQPVYRSYSIASSPAVKTEIEIEVKRVEGGASTTYIHGYLKAGDIATIMGPDGDLYLRNTERSIIFIAGGSGMAPIRSMLLDMLDKGIRRHATFFLGVKTRKDLVLFDEIRQLETELPHLKFIPVLSEAEPGDNWQGEKGLVTDTFNRLVKSGDNTEAYLCGNPPMINACLKALKSKGIPESLIYYDRFV
jgi:Na+-transporting NADH:ubiquinone oxidoreductase subunit F